MIIAGGQIFKMAASRFVDVSEEEIKNTRHATKFGMTLFKGKMKIVLNVTTKPFKFPGVKFFLMSTYMNKTKQQLNFRNTLFT